MQKLWLGRPHGQRQPPDSDTGTEERMQRGPGQAKPWFADLLSNAALHKPRELFRAEDQEAAADGFIVDYF